MLIYYCLILWIGMVSLFSINIKDKKKRNRIVIILCCLGVLIIQALRASYVGVDVNAYLKGYQIAKDINIFAGERLFNFEVGYIIYSQLFSNAMIVARNESAYIEKSLNSLINQTYPKDRYEILLIDGNSNDNTVEIAKNTVRSYCENNGNRSFNIKFLENPRQILAAGWNIGIKNSKGQYVVRIDAHSFVPPDYISKCVAVMLKVKDAVCVGGVINSDTIGEKGKAVSYVLSSPFGIGNSKFRYSQKAEYVDTVAFGLYRKDIFEKVGYFDENLQRNQDIELHAKIRAAGGKFYLDPKINLTYFSRNTTKSMIEQGYQNGKWNAIVFKKNPKSLSIRHIIPLLFALGIIGCLLLGLITPFFWYVLLIVLVLHLILGVVFALQKTKKLSYILTMPIMFMLLHISYGAGTLINLVAVDSN